MLNFSTTFGAEVAHREYDTFVLDNNEEEAVAFKSAGEFNGVGELRAAAVKKRSSQSRISAPVHVAPVFEEKTENIEIPSDALMALPNVGESILPIVEVVSPVEEDTPSAQEITSSIKIISGKYFVHGNHLGSSSITTDEDGNIARLVDYFPFGETRNALETGN